MSSPRDGVEFEVKIGESITRQNHPGFHLLKCNSYSIKLLYAVDEFKPGSIDPSLPGRLSLSQKHASVYLPEKVTLFTQTLSIRMAKMPKSFEAPTKTSAKMKLNVSSNGTLRLRHLL